MFNCLYYLLSKKKLKNCIYYLFFIELALCHAFKIAETGNDNKAIALSGGLAKLSIPEEVEKGFVGLEVPSLLLRTVGEDFTRNVWALL